MLKTIEDQFDVIRICLNEFEECPKFIRDNPKIEWTIPDNNLTDNGKFRPLSFVRRKPEYYFTLDDDILYPANYVEETVKNIDEYGTIVTYHGRRLLAKGLHYYQEHEFHGCRYEQTAEPFEVDVCGTGVCAFRTDYMDASNIAYSPDQLMSDLVFSLEAAKQGKTIGIFKRPEGWIKDMEVKDSIFKHFQQNPRERQTELANEIFDLRYKTTTS
jgi:hypothetical protein